MGLGPAFEVNEKVADYFKNTEIDALTYEGMDKFDTLDLMKENLLEKINKHYTKD